MLTVYTETELTISNKEEAATDQLLAVKSNVSANITLSGVNIDATDSVKERPNYMYEDEYESEESSEAEGLAAFGIAEFSSGDVTITLEGTNVLKGGNEHAALEKNGANGSLTICGTGSLISTGGTYGAGIGGSYGRSTSNIAICDGIVTATGSSGIGGGYCGSATNIIISGGSVKASSIGTEPKSSSDFAENVYLLVVENPNKEFIIIDGKAFTPITHNDENRIYVYLTVEEHTVQIGKNTNRFSFVDGVFEEEPEPVSAMVVGHGLTLSTLGVEFYMSLGESVTSDENSYMLFALPSGKTQRIYVKDAGSKVIDDKQCYVFPCYVAPAETSDEISAQIVTGEGETSDTYTYSLAEQCVDMIDSGSSEAEKALAKAILNYGTQAQLFFKHNTDKPANASLAEGDRELEAVSVKELMACRYNVADNDDEIDFIGQGVQLNDNVAVKFYFSGNIDTSICRINGKRISSTDIGKDANGSYIIIRDILPEDLDEAYTITAGAVTISNASVFSYLYSAIKTQCTDLYHIVYALYAYNKAAEAYFA